MLPDHPWLEFSWGQLQTCTRLDHSNHDDTGSLVTLRKQFH